jgi:hypothetical protein
MVFLEHRDTERDRYRGGEMSYILKHELGLLAMGEES